MNSDFLFALYESACLGELLGQRNNIKVGTEVQEYSAVILVNLYQFTLVALNPVEASGFKESGLALKLSAVSFELEQFGPKAASEWICF